MPGTTVVKMAGLLKSQVGYKEGPRNNETKYGADYGFNFVAWCAIFLSWGSKYSGAMYLGRPWRFASTVAARDHAKRHGRWRRNPAVGSLCMMAHTATTGHIGFVIGILSNGNIVSVEGNTNDQGGREGNLVAIRIRSPREWDGYIELDETLGSTPPPVVEPPKPQFGRYFYPMVGGFWAESTGVARISRREIQMKTGIYSVGGDGGVFTLGPGATFHGSTGGVKLEAPVVGGVPHPSGHGYWLPAADGGLFCFGNARFFGNLKGIRLAAPVVDLVPTRSGNGYTFVTADGGTFVSGVGDKRFGDAQFLGSLAQVKLHKSIIEAHGTRSGKGMFLLGEDGGVFTLGDAVYANSAVERAKGKRAVSMAVTPSERGYFVLCDDYTIIRCGDAPDWGQPTPGKYKARKVLISNNGGVVLAEDGGLNKFGGEVEWWGSFA